MNGYTKYTGCVKAIVINTDDPAGYHRIKVRIPSIHGIIDNSMYQDLKHTDSATEYRWVDDKHLPWAEVCYPFGSTTLPEVNQVVWVMFYNGNPDYPVVIGWAGYEYTTVEQPYTLNKRMYRNY